MCLRQWLELGMNQRHYLQLFCIECSKKCITSMAVTCHHII